MIVDEVLKNKQLRNYKLIYDNNIYVYDVYEKYIANDANNNTYLLLFVSFNDEKSILYDLLSSIVKSTCCFRININDADQLMIENNDTIVREVNY